MAVLAAKIAGSFYELTITDQIDTFTLTSNTISAGKVQLTGEPRENKKVRAWIQTSSGNLYPELQNYHLISTGADFDIIKESGDSFLRFSADHLSSTMPLVNSTLTVFYEIESQGDEVITDPEDIADAVWNQNSPTDIASAVWTQNTPQSIQSSTADAVWEKTIQSQEASEILRRIYQINSGAWKLDTETRRLRFYDSDGTTILFEFDMLDAQGNATVSSVFERRPRT